MNSENDKNINNSFMGYRFIYQVSILKLIE